MNENAGICMWQKHKGYECNSNCERYRKCFTCKCFQTCEEEMENVLCEIIASSDLSHDDNL